jgi:tetratricopeptide (TPR) repeat protein
MTQRPYFSRINQLARFLSREDEQGYAFACIQDERLLPAATKAIIEAAQNKYHTQPNVCQLEQASPILSQLQSAMGETGGLIVQGLPHYLAEEGKVQSLNYAREGIVQLGRPILFWVDEPTLRRISNLATDLFSQRRMVVVYFDETAEIELPDDFLQSRFQEEYRSQEAYRALELQVELKKRQLREAEEAGLPAQRLAIDFALPLAEAYAEFDGQRKAVELLEQYPPTDEAWPQDKLRAVGNIYWVAGKYEHAIQYLKKALNHAPEGSTLQSSLLSDLGDIHRDVGKYAEALQYYELDLSLSQRLTKQNPQSEQLQRDLGVAIEKLADLLMRTGKTNDAAELYHERTNIARTLAKQNPQSEQLQRDLGVAISKLADLLMRTGKTNDAAELYDENIHIARTLAKQNPQSEQLQRDLSVAYYKLGQLKTKEGHVEEARQYYLKDLEIAQAIQAQNPESIGLADDLLTTYLGFAERATRAEEAIPFLEKALPLAQNLYQRTGQPNYKELAEKLKDQH